jgi:glycosyltransferase involved in cell wall biosynthesis
VTAGKFPYGISVFFPAYNDGGTIASLVIVALNTLREITDDYEIIVIENGSSDYTSEVLDEMACVYPGLRVYHFPASLGYGGALRQGFALATKEWVFYTDGDGQYDPHELKDLVAALKPGVDMVNGWKIKRHDPLHRTIIGWLYQYFVKIAFGLVIRDVDCDFRLIRHAVFERVTLESSTGTITFEMVKKIQDAGFKIVEVPVHHWYRQYGTSQFFNFPRVARTLLALVRWWWRLVVKKEHLRAAATDAHADVEGA